MGWDIYWLSFPVSRCYIKQAIKFLGDTQYQFYSFKVQLGSAGQNLIKVVLLVDTTSDLNNNFSIFFGESWFCIIDNYLYGFYFGYTSMDKPFYCLLHIHYSSIPFQDVH